MWLAELKLQPQGVTSGWLMLEDPATGKQGIMPVNHLGEGKAARRAPQVPNDNDHDVEV